MIDRYEDTPRCCGDIFAANVQSKFILESRLFPARDRVFFGGGVSDSYTLCSMIF